MEPSYKDGVSIALQENAFTLFTKDVVETPIILKPKRIVSNGVLVGLQILKPPRLEKESPFFVIEFPTLLRSQ